MGSGSPQEVRQGSANSLQWFVGSCQWFSFVLLPIVETVEQNFQCPFVVVRHDFFGDLDDVPLSESLDCVGCQRTAAGEAAKGFLAPPKAETSN